MQCSRPSRVHQTQVPRRRPNTSTSPGPGPFLPGTDLLKVRPTPLSQRFHRPSICAERERHGHIIVGRPRDPPTWGQTCSRPVPHLEAPTHVYSAGPETIPPWDRLAQGPSHPPLSAIPQTKYMCREREASPHHRWPAPGPGHEPSQRSGSSPWVAGLVRGLARDHRTATAPRVLASLTPPPSRR